MTARQIGYLASRLFAAYLLIEMIPAYASILAHYLLHAQAMNGNPPLIYALQAMTFPIIGGIAAYIFWYKASWVTSWLVTGLPESTPDDLQYVKWERLGLLVAGAFAIASAVTEVSRLLAEVMIYDWFSDDLQHNSYLLTYIFHILGSLFLAFVFLARPDSFLAMARALRRKRLSEPDQDEAPH